MEPKIDPVCGLEVTSREYITGGPDSGYGQTYYFCSEDCKEEFDANPEDYI